MYLYASLMFRGLLHVFRCPWNAVNWFAFIYLIYETVRCNVGTCLKQQLCNCWLSLLKEGCLCLYQICGFVYVLEFSSHAYISFTSIRIFLQQNPYIEWAEKLHPFFTLLIVVYSQSIFTARCYAERGYETACRLSVRLSLCPSVSFRYRDHMDWNSSKIIWRPNSLRSMRSLAPNMGDLVQRKQPHN